MGPDFYIFLNNFLIFYNILLTFWASYRYLADPKGQLEIEKVNYKKYSKDIRSIIVFNPGPVKHIALVATAATGVP